MISREVNYKTEEKDGKFVVNIVMEDTADAEDIVNNYNSVVQRLDALNKELEVFDEKAQKTKEALQKEVSDLNKVKEALDKIINKAKAKAEISKKQEERSPKN